MSTWEDMRKSIFEQIRSYFGQKQLYNYDQQGILIIETLFLLIIESMSLSNYISPILS